MSDLDYDDDDISGNEYNEVEERGSDEGKLTDLNNVFLSKRMKRFLTSLFGVIENREFLSRKKGK